MVFPVLIPGQNFLFPGTGREITKYHGKGNLRLVFLGITGNGNYRSPLRQSHKKQKLSGLLSAELFTQKIQIKRKNHNLREFTSMR